MRGIYICDPANRLIDAITGSMVTMYTWDANGNLTSDGSNTYTYDTANRLIEYTDGTTSIVSSYAYDGLGNRYGGHGTD